MISEKELEMIFFLRYNESSGRPNFEVLTEFEKILNQNENLVPRCGIFIIWKWNFPTVEKTQLFMKRCIFIIFSVLKNDSNVVGTFAKQLAFEETLLKKDLP